MVMVGLVQFNEVYFVFRAVRDAVVRWFIPIQSVFILIHSCFIPIHVVFIPIHKPFIPIQAALIPIRPLSPKNKDPEKYLGLNFFLFITVNFEVVVVVRSFIRSIQSVFIPIRAAFIPIRPISPKIIDPEKYLGQNFFLFNLAISVNFGAGF